MTEMGQTLPRRLAGRAASGADKVTIEEFETHLDENLERLHQELRENTYRPQAVRRLEIPNCTSKNGHALRQDTL
jgi:RNA-directed DNA polymerase